MSRGLGAWLAVSILAGCATRVQDESPRPSPHELVVAMPKGILALWQDGLTDVQAFSGGEWIATAKQTERLLTVVTDRPEAIDELLLIGGAHARWARRVEHGGFVWDDTGYVVLGRMPADMGPNWTDITRPVGCHVDMLGPVDAQVAPGVARLYPVMRMDHVNDERFVVGVPAPGCWDVILHVDGGVGDLVARCEAVPDGVLPMEPPFVPMQAVTARVEFDLSLLPESERSPQKVDVVSDRGNGTWWLHPHGGLASVSMGAADFVRQRWIWHAGWECQRVDGSEFAGFDAVIDRIVNPARHFFVVVRDAAGTPLENASVSLEDTAGAGVPAAWSASRTVEGNNLGRGGRTGADGLVRVDGAPPGFVHTIRARVAGGIGASIVVVWDGAEETFDVVLPVAGHADQ